MRALIVIASLLASATAGACTIVDASGAYRATVSSAGDTGDTAAQTQLFSGGRLVGFRSDTVVIRTDGSVAGYVVGSSLLSSRGVVIATGNACTADQLATAHLTLF